MSFYFVLCCFYILYFMLCFNSSYALCKALYMPCCLNVLYSVLALSVSFLLCFSIRTGGTRSHSLQVGCGWPAEMVWNSCLFIIEGKSQLSGLLCWPLLQEKSTWMWTIQFENQWFRNNSNPPVIWVVLFKMPLFCFMKELILKETIHSTQICI